MFIKNRNTGHGFRPFPGRKGQNPGVIRLCKIEIDAYRQKAVRRVNTIFTSAAAVKERAGLQCIMLVFYKNICIAAGDVEDSAIGNFDRIVLRFVIYKCGKSYKWIYFIKFHGISFMYI